MSDYTNLNQDYEREGQAHYGRTQPIKSNRSSRPQYRAKSRPSGFNGMHRRRAKRWAW